MRAVVEGSVAVNFIWDLISCCCDGFMALAAVIGTVLRWCLLWVTSFGSRSGI